MEPYLRSIEWIGKILNFTLLFTYTNRPTYSKPGINRRVLRIPGVFTSLKNAEEIIAINNHFFYPSVCMKQLENH